MYAWLSAQCYHVQMILSQAAAVRRSATSATDRQLAEELAAADSRRLRQQLQDYHLAKSLGAPAGPDQQQAGRDPRDTSDRARVSQICSLQVAARVHGSRAGWAGQLTVDQGRQSQQALCLCGAQLSG